MRTLVPTSTTAMSVKDYRDVMTDPTKNLLNVMRTNSFTRIKSALTVPGIHFGSRDPEHDLQTLLMRVCRLDMPPRNRRDLAKILLDKQQLDVNAKDSEGMTALAHACMMGDTTMLKLLAEEADVDPNIADREGDTPLLHACRAGQDDLVATLLTHFVRCGLQVDQSNNQGVTPLIEAARGGHADICRRLVTIGNADVNARDGDTFNTAQDYAIASRRLSTPDILLLSPIAQRKLQARKKREAMGRSSLCELMKRASFYPTTGWQQEDSGNTFVIEHRDGKLKQRSKAVTATLHQEHLQQLNSTVFQVAKYGLSRVAEQRQEEDELSADTEKPRQRKISLSLPDLREEDLDQDIKLTSTRSNPLSKSSSQDNHLRVPHRPSPSNSPILSRRSTPSPSRLPHPPVSPSKLHNPRLKLPFVDSPSQSPASVRRRGSVPNKVSMGSKPVVRMNAIHHSSMGLSQSPPNSWAPSANSRSSHAHGQVPVVHIVTPNKNVESRTRLSWEGKPSSSVPSYLFR
ncbi:ankyrin repeat, SAM and basic leucine zipper domain-containing protein 1-like [Acanthaster planci]|uniref:Ankyrin repeat, SAM and basic leucine zipper domain-containing protein 1-like n=1 Tax=Acanthaster planci TaxID=133434 RepID=A0A8B7ZLT3_ACAPL|nr:ankyrin repeat, SAM and basic leucine zipper domain-containing protein 1-like [Acanthaster planci]XP_022106574.1 ankyrin repeat, SAM and basic leucine zipper domain-containing protein 1-like [Acanthaster planci]